MSTKDLLQKLKVLQELKKLKEHLATVQPGVQASNHGEIPQLDISRAVHQTKDGPKDDSKVRSKADIHTAAMVTTKQGNNYCTKCNSPCVCGLDGVSTSNFGAMSNTKVDSNFHMSMTPSVMPSVMPTVIPSAFPRENPVQVTIWTGRSSP